MAGSKLCCGLLVLAMMLCSASAMDTVANAVSIYNGFSKVDNTDIVKGDIACGKDKFCKVCYTAGDVKGPVSFESFGKTGDQGNKLFYFFSEKCRATSGCKGFTFEKANPLCAYLKGFAKAANLNGRPGWVAVSTEVMPPAPNMCKGGCGKKKLLL